MRLAPNSSHNSYVYLSSRTMAGQSPSYIQVLRFLKEAHVLTAHFPLGLGHLV